MTQIVTVGNRTFEVVGDVTPEIAQSLVLQKIQGEIKPSGCSACQQKNSRMLNFGTANCDGPYLLDSTHTLSATVTNGTAPFTYTWTITPPTGIPQVLNGQTQQYTFTQSGVYGINLAVRDSCPAGGLTDSASCSVTVNAACITPSCSINIT